MSALQTKPPLNVYVVWHPKFSDAPGGAGIADHLYRTLTLHPRKVLSPGLGIPVYFRTSRENGAKPPVPAAIDLERALHSVVVLLVDTHFALDDAWVAYARGIADTALAGDGDAHARRRHLALPILFIDRDLSPDLGRTQSIDLSTDALGPRLTMLQLRVMAEICRLLHNMPRGDSKDLQLSPEPVHLFISHAKADGLDDAEELLSKIEKTPLEAFFDKKHIASGWDFSDEIRGQIRRSALVALQSDAYGSRPWCRREILEAKKHERPIVLVSRLREGEDRSFPYLGNVPTINWTGNNHYEIIAATVREYLRKLYVEARFAHLEKTGFLPQGARHLVRPPELVDGALFRRRPTSSPDEHAKADAAEKAATQTGAARPAEAPKQLVVYPDPPLGREELEILADFFPEIAFETPTTLAWKKSLKDRTIALSISDSPDLIKLGADQSHHLMSAMSEIARHILVREGRLAYGGDLRPSAEGGFTDELFELVRAYMSAGILPTSLVSNYLAFPIYLALDKNPELELKLKRVAQLVRVGVPAGLVKRFDLNDSAPIPKDLEAGPYVVARCLTEMRRTMTEKSHARVALGGKVVGYSGKYPGILEEAYLALNAGKPLYLLGAFGGCTGLIIKAVRKEKVEELTTEYQTARSQAIGAETAYGRLLRQYDSYCKDPEIGDSPINYDQIVKDFNAAGVAGLNNGLTADENEELFASENLDRLVSLLMKGLTSRLG
jgi:hypothetical protein